MASWRKFESGATWRRDGIELLRCVNQDAASVYPLASSHCRVVTGTRLDAPGSFSAGNPGTHAYADFGTAMLVGVPTPARGCWEIRAHYKGAELAYVIDF